MGQVISRVELINIEAFAKRVISLAEARVANHVGAALLLVLDLQRLTAQRVGARPRLQRRVRPALLAVADDRVPLACDGRRLEVAGLAARCPHGRIQASAS